MPYMNFNHFTKEDLYSIVAYIRSLKPIENKSLDSKIKFPVSMLIKMGVPEHFNPSEEIDKNDSIKYGKYLVSIGGCSDCHTPMKEGKPIKGMDFAGGQEFLFPGGIVRSANISPDDETGIGKMTKDQFIKRFKTLDNAESKNITVKMKDFNTPMPWLMFAGMTEEDLGLIYDYLRTIPPKHNAVVKFSKKKEITKD